MTAITYSNEQNILITHLFDVSTKAQLEYCATKLYHAGKKPIFATVIKNNRYNSYKLEVTRKKIIRAKKF